VSDRGEISCSVFGPKQLLISLEFRFSRVENAQPVHHTSGWY